MFIKTISQHTFIPKSVQIALILSINVYSVYNAVEFYCFMLFNVNI